MNSKINKICIITISICVIIFIYQYSNQQFSKESIASNADFYYKDNVYTIDDIKKIINEQYNGEFNINVEDIRKENIYQIRQNNKELIIVHNSKSEQDDANLIIFEKEDKNLKIVLCKTNIQNFHIVESSFLLLETQITGVGSGEFGSQYLVYDFNYDLIWSGNSYMTHVKNNSNTEEKIFGNIQLNKDELIYTYSNVIIHNKSQISFSEKVQRFEYKNNKFIEITN